MDPYIYEQQRMKMCKTAMAFGISSAICSIVFFSMPYMAIGFGGFAILFSVLSKGVNPKMDKEGKLGFATGIIGLVVSLVIIISVFSALKNNPEYRQNVAELISTMYGSEFEQEYGISIEDALKETIGE